jgi:hypothetical protein
LLLPRLNTPTLLAVTYSSASSRLSSMLSSTLHSPAHDRTNNQGGDKKLGGTPRKES